jgi:hypothetical protein
MTIIYHGERRTPKEMAALLLKAKIEELPDDWTPENLPEQPNSREHLLVVEQLERYQARIRRLLGFDSTDEEVSDEPQAW